MDKLKSSLRPLRRETCLLKTEESRIHEVPVDQSRKHADDEHAENDYSFLSGFGPSAHGREKEKEDAADADERRKCGHFQVINALRPQAVPTVVDEPDGQENQHDGEKALFDVHGFLR